MDIFRITKEVTFLEEESGKSSQESTTGAVGWEDDKSSGEVISVISILGGPIEVQKQDNIDSENI